MKNNKIMYLFFAILIGTAACKQKDLTLNTYMNYWVRYKEQISDQKTIGKRVMKITYLSTDFLILNDINGLVTKEVFNKSKGNFCDYHYLTLDVSNEQKADEVKKYFIHDRQNQFSLIFDKDTLPCILYHPESIGVGSQMKIDLIFKRQNEQTCDSTLGQDLNIRYEDNQDGLREIVNFIIKKEKINQLTKIKI